MYLLKINLMVIFLFSSNISDPDIMTNKGTPICDNELNRFPMINSFEVVLNDAIKKLVMWIITTEKIAMMRVMSNDMFLVVFTLLSPYVYI